MTPIGSSDIEFMKEFVEGEGSEFHKNYNPDQVRLAKALRRTVEAMTGTMTEIAKGDYREAYHLLYQSLTQLGVPKIGREEFLEELKEKK